MSVFTRKTFCVITGASRGYGKTVAEMLAERLPSASVIVLSARNGNLLESFKQKLTSKHPSVLFYCWQSDLANPCYRQFSDFLKQLFQENNMKADNFEQCLLVHNAGILGDISQQHLETTNRDEIDEYWRINITSMMLLNAALLPMFKSHLHQLVVNISSLCSIVPFKGFSLYCAGKAAREQLLNCLALENANVRLLHWAPGPMKTDMLDGQSDHTIDPNFLAVLKSNNMLTCEQSAVKLMALLGTNTFANKSHVDYYDIDEQATFLIPQKE